MSLPSYQVVMLDPYTGDVQFIFDPVSFYDMRYSRVLNGIGLVAMTLPATAAIRQALRWDAFIEVQRTDPLTGHLRVEGTYLLRLTHRFRDGQDERLVIGGLSLEHLLARRIIDPNDDPNNAGGYSTKAGPADTVMRDYIREQAADLASPDRSFPGLSVQIVEGNGPGNGQRLRHENLLTVLQSIAKKSTMDFWIERTTSNLMQVRIGIRGEDKRFSTNFPAQGWLGLDPARGNMADPSLQFDRREEGNYCYALGQGQGDTRSLLEVEGDGITDTPFNRIEFIHDARNADKVDIMTLYTEALQALKEKRTKREFTFRMSGTDVAQFYRVDWDLGTKLTVTWDDDSQDLRITEIEPSISANGEEFAIKVEAI